LPGTPFVRGEAKVFAKALVSPLLGYSRYSAAIPTVDALGRRIVHDQGGQNITKDAEGKSPRPLDQGNRVNELMTKG